MSGDDYLKKILIREMVDASANSPVRKVQQTIDPVIKEWAGSYLIDIGPSGSFAKGTANKSGTDIDLFISLSSSTPNTMREIYNSLHDWMSQKGHSPRKQNVSIGIKVNGYGVDLVPGRRQDQWGATHWLYVRKKDTWKQTNINTHIITVGGSNRLDEIRIVKLWRNQKGLDWPSAYIELMVIDALAGKWSGQIAKNVMSAFEHIRDKVETRRIVDPANTNNVISDDLTAAEKKTIAEVARKACNAKYWSEIVQ